MIRIVRYQHKGTPEEDMAVPKHVELCNFIFRKSLKRRENGIKCVIK
jgi:hypothetical protein